MLPNAIGPHQNLINEYVTYDEHVDVVSAFEWLFTDPGVKDLPATVHHFERFPRIRQNNSPTLTPDFTVLFADHTAIVGEIAKIALNENSVDKLCKQRSWTAWSGSISGLTRRTESHAQAITFAAAMVWTVEASRPGDVRCFTWSLAFRGWRVIRLCRPHRRLARPDGRTAVGGPVLPEGASGLAASSPETEGLIALVVRR